MITSPMDHMVAEGQMVSSQRYVTSPAGKQIASQWSQQQVQRKSHQPNDCIPPDAGGHGEHAPGSSHCTEPPSDWVHSDPRLAPQTHSSSAWAEQGKVGKMAGTALTFKILVVAPSSAVPGTPRGYWSLPLGLSHSKACGSLHVSEEQCGNSAKCVHPGDGVKN